MAARKRRVKRIGKKRSSKNLKVTKMTIHAPLRLYKGEGRYIYQLFNPKTGYYHTTKAKSKKDAIEILTRNL